MSNADFLLCQKIISDLIVPAFCAKDGYILAANKMACDLFPCSPIGKSVYDFFPEAVAVSEYACKCFDAVSLDGIDSVNVSSLLDFELWQLTPSNTLSRPQTDSLTKNEVSHIFAQINLLQHHCPDQRELFSAIYKSCCRLLKSTSQNSDPVVPPILYVFDLAKESERFISECRDVFFGLGITVDTDELCRFTYISADKNVLDNIFAGLLCLCAHEVSPQGSVSLSVTQKNGRAVLSFAAIPCGKTETTELSESDKLLTRQILQNNLSRLNGMLFTVSNGDSTVFIVSFPISDGDYVLSDYPVFPSVGIPAHLIQLSSILPSEFYSKLN